MVAAHTLDENVWQNWLAKNRKQEAAFYGRLIRLAVIVLPLALAALLFFTLSR